MTDINETDMAAAGGEALPDKLSDLIARALDDMERLDRDAYRPGNGCYHGVAGGAGPTRICLAGALMAGSLGAPEGAYMSPASYCKSDPLARRKVIAVDCARDGRLLDAIVEIEFQYVDDGETYPEARARIESELSVDERQVIDRWASAPPVWANFASWWSYERFAPSMREMARQLAGVGR